MLKGAKNVLSRGRRSFAFIVAAAVMLSVMSIGQEVKATVPIPNGWTIYFGGLVIPGVPNPGVRVFRKKNSRGVYEYVTIVDMRYASLRSFTGDVKNGPNGPGYSLVTRHNGDEYWRRGQLQNTSKRKAAVVINGTFFDDTQPNWAGISFGLRSEWWRMSYGYEIEWKTFPKSQILVFAYNPDTATSAIQTHTYPIFDGNYPSVVGGLSANANKDPNSTAKKRTFVGIRDDNFDGKNETVIFFSSPGATQTAAADTLLQFGTSARMMLDGGTSGTLMVNGAHMYSSSARVPQAFVIYTGK